jgi:hypothetical protein
LDKPAQESFFQHSSAEDRPPRSYRSPLTARYLEVVAFQRDDGEPVSALKLTGTLVWQLNRTFRCEYKISKCLERISAIKTRRLDLDKMVEELNELLQLSTDDKDRTSPLQGLQDAEDMAKDFNQEIEVLEKKMHYWREEMALLNHICFST